VHRSKTKFSLATRCLESNPSLYRTMIMMMMMMMIFAYRKY
jgi:hypothetical protein